LFRSITEKKILEDEVLRNYAHDIILKDISSNLLNLSFSKTDDGIKDALEMIGKNIKADRGFVYLFGDDRESVSNPYEWHQPDTVESKILETDIICLPWLIGLFDQRDFLHINDTSKLP